jgi:hypothetical protein
MKKRTRRRKKKTKKQTKKKKRTLRVELPFQNNFFSFSISLLQLRVIHLIQWKMMMIKKRVTHKST